ncbi:Hpt domain-containing protein [[Limnothrix rosea] IAM M-220]|uniref:Hpt domain-containing protein n=1 Tax=[Limnothrix rosea] IAM M-220 TaxID=454133 RepID=UPI0009678AFF|nr:Hpt domain-containing protein [[Limnothrix rosea] IAM M-220]OKH18289.1 hypothetical protein NIES208_06060 [[Limnothrix rosea] IAM M-220]
MFDDSRLAAEISLDDLMEIVSDDVEVLKDVLKSFLEDAPKLLQEMQNGLLSQDLETIERNAHTLKSNSRLFRAKIFAEQCQALEDNARQSNWSSVTVQVPKLCQNFQVIARVLTAKLEQL